MAEKLLDINSSRAYKARYRAVLAKDNIRYVSWGFVAFSIFAAFALLIAESKFAGLALVPGIIAYMIETWYNGELKYLADDNDGRSIQAKLDPEILANLKNDNPSAYELWNATKDTEARWFFQNRFILHHSIFETFLNQQSGSSDEIWKIAEELAEKYKLNGLPASVIVVALLKSIPGIEDTLRRVKLELREIEEGIEWLSDIEAKRRLARQKQYFGGLARDWAYGYTPILRYLGHNITEEVQLHGFFADTAIHQQIVNQMVNSLGTGSGSITLVGDIGVGKTTVAYAFAERLIKDKNVPKPVLHHQVVGLDAPSLLAQTKSINELENLIIRVVNEASRAKNIILFLDDAHVFFGEGHGSVDLTNIMQQVLDSGAVKLVLALTPRQWQNIGAKNPTIGSKLQPLQVQQANEKETIKILRDQVLLIEYKRKVLFTHQALKEAFRLGSRYIDSQSMPGAALAVLEGAAPVASNGYVTAETIQTSIEASVGVKIKQSKGDESQVLLNLEKELHKYVISQKHAVGVIANALRRSRSGVGNPERPVGTFLFLGPTGVGKTELSKALARVYFGDESAMIRVDMNQFVSPDDVRRLITPMLGEQLGFLGQVRRRPFSVILLDEIEKAHPSVINLLLQTLDEGVMRDVDNKAVSFKDSIIIATSNAGADLIRQYLDKGESYAKIQEVLVDTIIDRQTFTPEFINRFDEVVMFSPLSGEELLDVIDLIIDGINKTMDKQKVQVELTVEAKKWLVEKGYDPKLGARPMRRVVQKYVENILARRILESPNTSGSLIKLDISDFQNIEEM